MYNEIVNVMPQFQLKNVYGNNFNLRPYTEASVISLTAAASTMLRITNFLIALSFGTHLAQLVHLTGFT